ncbi:MAG TPA: hypothetical protein VLG50_04225 [Candidatus Saccharimonadales bacterium]|nr:hypothetical protein [Candidatus Saccharimonadales bacterium]
MNKKISLVMLFGLSLNTAQQFFASIQNSVSNKDVEARVQAFREEQKRTEQELKRTEQENARKRYADITKKLVELAAFQKMLAENNIVKIGQFPSLRFDEATQNYIMTIGYGRVSINESLSYLYYRILKLKDERERVETMYCCCFPDFYFRRCYNRDSDLSVVFARVQCELEASRKPFEKLLNNQSHKQTHNEQRA